MSTLTSQPSATDVARAWVLLDELTDPEIPVVTLRELGILRDVRAGDTGLEERTPVSAALTVAILQGLLTKPNKVNITFDGPAFFAASLLA